MKKTNIDELTGSINKLLKRKIELQQELAAVSKKLDIENNKLMKLITGGTKSGPAKGKAKRKQTPKKDESELKNLIEQLKEETSNIDKQFAKLEKLK